MKTLEQFKDDIAAEKYNLRYNKLNLTEKLVVDWEIELSLQDAVAYSDYGAGI